VISTLREHQAETGIGLQSVPATKPEDLGNIFA
jgi:hypothetical protein